MGPLIVHCPKTTAPITTGIDTEYKSLARCWDKSIRVHCPHCHGVHVVKVREAFIRGEISSVTLRGE
jgi:hypothetical protein